MGSLLSMQMCTVIIMGQGESEWHHKPILELDSFSF